MGPATDDAAVDCSSGGDVAEVNGPITCSFTP